MTIVYTWDTFGHGGNLSIEEFGFCCVMHSLRETALLSEALIIAERPRRH